MVASMRRIEDRGAFKLDGHCVLLAGHTLQRRSMTPDALGQALGASRHRPWALPAAARYRSQSSIVFRVARCIPSPPLYASEEQQLALHHNYDCTVSVKFIQSIKAYTTGKFAAFPRGTFVTTRQVGQL